MKEKMFSSSCFVSIFTYLICLYCGAATNNDSMVLVPHDGWEFMRMQIKHFFHLWFFFPEMWWNVIFKSTTKRWHYSTGCPPHAAYSVVYIPGLNQLWKAAGSGWICYFNALIIRVQYIYCVWQTLTLAAPSHHTLNWAPVYIRTTTSKAPSALWPRCSSHAPPHMQKRPQCSCVVGPHLPAQAFPVCSMRHKYDGSVHTSLNSSTQTHIYFKEQVPMIFGWIFQIF